MSQMFFFSPPPQILPYCYLSFLCKYTFDMYKNKQTKLCLTSSSRRLPSGSHMTMSRLLAANNKASCERARVSLFTQVKRVKKGQLNTLKRTGLIVSAANLKAQERSMNQYLHPIQESSIQRLAHETPQHFPGRNNSHLFNLTHEFISQWRHPARLKP